MSALDSQLVCAGCGAELAPDDALPFRCPNAGKDGADHVLRRELDLTDQRFPALDDENPFVAFRSLLHSYRFARRAGMSDGDYVGLVQEIDAAVQDVDGRGFRVTPYGEQPELAAELGLAHVFVKDETCGVAGSHKGRHLMGLALQLHVARTAPERLAIASCGNAAFAAAVLARANGWLLETYVPKQADPEVLARLESLGASLIRCERDQDSSGDPCFERFRAAVDSGALPFTCQGSENGLVIEGGQTLGWELVAQHTALGAAPLDLVCVQVGGGALASALYAALCEARTLGALEALPRIFTLQTTGAHPLERAWRLVARAALHLSPEAGDVDHEGPAQEVAEWLFEQRASDEVASALAYAAHNRARFMWAWEEEPRSLARGILDDETYDWLVLVEAMIHTGGRPVIAGEEHIAAAHEIGRRLTSIDVSATGTAGLAGLYTLAAEGTLHADSNAAVLFTGGA